MHATVMTLLSDSSPLLGIILAFHDPSSEISGLAVNERVAEDLR